MTLFTLVPGSSVVRRSSDTAGLSGASPEAGLTKKSRSIRNLQVSSPVPFLAAVVEEDVVIHIPLLLYEFQYAFG